ncbi:MAG: alpha-galactosidase [Myxococcales bacterium]|nr:alpha-galactosidase [Myxococcales bacterium]
MRRAALIFTLALAGCGEDERLDVGVPSGRLDLRPRHNGTFDLRESGGAMLLRGAVAEAQVELGGAEHTVTTQGCAGEWAVDEAAFGTAPEFAHLRGFRRRCADSGVVLEWRLGFDAERDIALSLLRLTNETGAELRVLRLSPLVSAGPDAGLFVGANPARLRILDNGANVAADVDVKLHYPDEDRNSLVAAVIPIESRGNVVSNWNHAVLDLDSGRSFVAGALGVERSFPTLGTRYTEDDAPRFEGRAGLELWADNALEFTGKLLSSGESVDSEPLYLDAFAADPQTGLERYADAIAAWQGFTVWTQRGAGRRVPNGWNSWTGSSGTGGLGTNIDETSMGENLEVMAREFAPFGVDYFQVDDGYQLADGDWFPRTDRFPSGMPAWSARVKSKGLIPGLWISAFTVALDSTLAAERPELLAKPEDNVVGALLSPGSGKRVLDLSNPASVEWLNQTLHRYKDDWGMGWVKLDFAYQALPYVPRNSPKLTSIEVYKRAIREVREVLGDDVFYMGIALMGVNYGVVDSMRVTLDTGPSWEESDPFALLGDGGNFKSSVKSAARRYWLHNRVWVTHNDLLFFRTDTGHPEPLVTLDEAITLSSFIGLTGSIVKFGEDLRGLSPEQIQVWRKLLPIYPASARPLDLFTRMYPEQWLLPVEGTLAGSDARWWVLGLLNWGRNFDYTSDGTPTKMPDAARPNSVPLTNLGLSPEREYLASEFWGEKFLGTVKGTLQVEVAAHGHALVALREKTGHPQFLGHNRHFTQGATDLVSESWDASERSLTLVFDVDQGEAGAVPFEYRFRVFAPTGDVLTQSEVGDAVVTRAGEVLTIRLTPKKSQRVSLKLFFA